MISLSRGFVARPGFTVVGPGFSNLKIEDTDD